MVIYIQQSWTDAWDKLEEEIPEWWANWIACLKRGERKEAWEGIEILSPSADKEVRKKIKLIALILEYIWAVY